VKRVKIGGQAVMEGVMMKNGDRYAVAVRKPDQEIEVKVVDYVSIGSKSVFFRIPIIRGVVNFIESLVIGVKTLMYSASFYDEEEDSESTRSVEKQRTQKQQKKSDDLAMYGTVAFSLVFAIALFMMLPAFIGELIGRVVESRVLMSAIEGVIRLAIFIGYVALISLMKDIQRVFMYHGAEHKTINCFEAGVSLTGECQEIFKISQEMWNELFIYRHDSQHNSVYVHRCAIGMDEDAYKAFAGSCYSRYFIRIHHVCRKKRFVDSKCTLSAGKVGSETHHKGAGS